MSKIYTIIAAGGLGTRLQHYDDSKKTKMLLEINGESMIIKQISQLMSWNLEKFIVITNPNVDKLIKNELKDKMPDLDIKYCLQEEQLGVAHALLQAEKLIEKNSKILYILGDNFFENNPITNINLFNSKPTIFLKEVNKPQDFGVVELADNKIKSIVEKPMNPQSNYVAVGLYLFDFDCFEYIKSIEKSTRGEYEITSLIEKYLHIDNLNYKFANGWWIDAGTPEAIKNIENLI